MTTVVQRGQQMLLVQLKKKKKEWSGWVESSPMGRWEKRNWGIVFTFANPLFKSISFPA